MNGHVQGYVMQKRVDGRFIGICLLTFSRARLVIGNDVFIDDLW